MHVNSLPDHSGATPPLPTDPSGCIRTALLAAAAAWIVAGAAVAQLLLWILEQALLEGSFPAPDLRWLVTLIYGLTQFAPLLAVTLVLPRGGSRIYFRSWMQASILALILFPARLLPITAAHETALLQLVGMGILLAGLRWWRTRKADGHIPPAGRARLSPALLAPALLALPWVLIGALGSPLDSLLGLALGLLFGSLAADILHPIWLAGEQPEDVLHPVLRFAGDGLAAALTLLILLTGLGQNGSQWLLALALPGLGWASAALSVWGRKEGAAASRLPLALLIGLAAAQPLIWIDSDELSLVISGGSGELMGWALRAGLYSLGLALLAGLIYYFLVRSAAPHRKRGALPWLAALAWLALFGLYFWWGQPGFYGERLFVILNDQPDVSEAASTEDYVLRRQTVYRALTEHAGLSQAGLRAELDRYGIAYTPYYLVNSLEVQGGALVRWWLQARPEVDRVLDSPVLRPLPAAIPVSTGSDGAPQDVPWNLSMIGVEAVWALGVRGEGIVIGQSDSGVEASHPELASSYRGWHGDHDYNWFDPWNGSPQPVDFSGHGTHTLGSIVGSQVGVAPKAQWIGCVNLARNFGNPAVYLDCMQFMLAPFPMDGDPFKDGAPEVGAHVLNNSWSCPEIEGCDPLTFITAVKALRQAGLFVVASAGNAGYSGCGSVKDPLAIYEGVYTVGAVNQLGDLTEFSSLGPVLVDESNRTKPDVVAPGAEVLSAYPNGSYQTASGTSMAAPHVAGTVALLWSANPALIGDIERTEEILNRSANAYRGKLPECVFSSQVPNNATGYGILDAFAAVRAGLELKEAAE